MVKGAFGGDFHHQLVCPRCKKPLMWLSVSDAGGVRLAIKCQANRAACKTISEWYITAGEAQLVAARSAPGGRSPVVSMTRTG